MRVRPSPRVTGVEDAFGSGGDRGIDRGAVLLQGVAGPRVGGDDEHLTAAVERVSHAVRIGEIAAPDTNPPRSERRGLIGLAHADADVLRREMLQKMFDDSAAERAVGTTDDDHVPSLVVSEPGPTPLSALTLIA